MREAMAQATRKAARASGGRPVPAANLHVTLAFLGSVPERRLGELAEIARAAAARPAVASANAPRSPPGAARESADSPEGSLELAFDHLEYWRAAQLLCALPAEAPAQVAALARRLQDPLAASGFAPDLKPFRPHVTVVRKVSRPGRIEKIHSVVWSFTELTLIESRTLPEGALYSVVESYPLCSGTKTANNSEMP
jgi:2'-5' RNA ligase